MEKNIYAEGLSAIGGTTGMKGVLPVKLDIPFSGREDELFARRSSGRASAQRCGSDTRGRGFRALLFYLVTALCAVIFTCLIIAARRSVEARRLVIDQTARGAVRVGAGRSYPDCRFPDLEAGAVWWGLGIAVIIGGVLFARDLAEKIREIALRAKAQRIDREKQGPATGKEA